VLCQSDTAWSSFGTMCTVLTSHSPGPVSASRPRPLASVRVSVAGPTESRDAAAVGALADSGWRHARTSAWASGLPSYSTWNASASLVTGSDAGTISSGRP